MDFTRRNIYVYEKKKKKKKGEKGDEKKNLYTSRGCENVGGEKDLIENPSLEVYMGVISQRTQFENCVGEKKKK